MPLKISITGHRKLENAEEVRNRIKHVLGEIVKTGNEPAFEVYSCLASGSDSIFAELAVEMGGTLKTVLPMPVTEYQKDFDAHEVVLFNKLLSYSAKPEIIEKKIPKNSEERNNAYLKAGREIVDKSDVLIAIWDGEKSNGKGGTADIVGYARSSGKKVHHIKAYRSDISRLFLKYDKKAVRNKTIYEWLWILSILLSLSAALVLAFSISFSDMLKPDSIARLAKTEFIAVVLALTIILFLKSGDLNKIRIAYRRIAERLRVLEKFNTGCINIEKLENFSGLPQEVIEIEKKYQAFIYPENNFDRSRKSLLKLVEEQILYHTKNRPEIKEKTFHILEKLQFPLLIFFFLGVSSHYASVLIKGHEHLSHILHQVGLTLSLSMPPVYAAIEGYIYFKEYHKIFLDSEKMKAFFEVTKESIVDISVSEFGTLNNYAFQIMKNMDSENKEWGILIGQKISPGI